VSGSGPARAGKKGAQVGSAREKKRERERRGMGWADCWVWLVRAQSQL
jgi:hypothetical protein